MKNILLIFFLLSVTYNYSQNSQIVTLDKVVIKEKTPSLVLKEGEITGEKLIDQNSAMSVTLISANDNDLDTKLSLTPYRRKFLWKRNNLWLFC